MEYPLFYVFRTMQDIEECVHFTFPRVQKLVGNVWLKERDLSKTAEKLGKNKHYVSVVLSRIRSKLIENNVSVEYIKPFFV